MIHVATVHYKTDKWIDIQLRYLQRNIRNEFRVYAFIDHEDIEHAGKFYHCLTNPIHSHPLKLNLLADKILYLSKDDDDILIFLDGDAFPIGELSIYLKKKLQSFKLIAIKRLENYGDPQPHPAFCATTTGFWREVKGDWSSGYQWKIKSDAFITDTGGNLLKLLIDLDIEWYPMLRSNNHNLHPLWFGLYDGIIYHHGAGFRDALSRIDKYNQGLPLGCNVTISPQNAIQYENKKREIIAKSNDLSHNVFEMILGDEKFYKMFV